MVKALYLTARETGTGIPRKPDDVRYQHDPRLTLLNICNLLPKPAPLAPSDPVPFERWEGVHAGCCDVCEDEFIGGVDGDEAAVPEEFIPCIHCGVRIHEECFVAFDRPGDPWTRYSTRSEWTCTRCVQDKLTVRAASIEAAPNGADETPADMYYRGLISTALLAAMKEHQTRPADGDPTRRGRVALPPPANDRDQSVERFAWRMHRATIRWSTESELMYEKACVDDDDDFGF